MTSLRVICGLGPPQSKILATPMLEDLLKAKDVLNDSNSELMSLIEILSPFKTKKQSSEIAKLFLTSSCINKLSTFVPQFAIRFCRIKCFSKNKGSSYHQIDKLLTISARSLHLTLMLFMFIF